MFGIWGVLLGIPVYASAKVVISAIFNWYKKSAVCMKKKGRKSRVNNSQHMLQALDERDLIKADQYFHKALETDSSEVLYELASYLEGNWLLSSSKRNLPKNRYRISRSESEFSKVLLVRMAMLRKPLLTLEEIHTRK